MKNFKQSLCLFIVFISFSCYSAAQEDGYMSTCFPPTATALLEINNASARLLMGGEIWSPGSSPGYIVPKQRGTSAIKSGSVWIGGIGSNGQLKVSGHTRRYFQPVHYFAPGPLDKNGQTEPMSCHNWDRFFSVKAEDVLFHKKRFQESEQNGLSYAIEEIPTNILGWPAVGNPYFSDIHGFDLPTDNTHLASFYDHDLDGIYNPSKGDYPVVSSGMRNDGLHGELIPSEQVFHILNDLGINRDTAAAMQLQINATAFAYQTYDEMNDMTFYQYKVMNRSQEAIDEMYFSISVDPQLGCYADDFIGADTSRNMFYIYNEDAVDGIFGSDCNGIPTYGENIPIVGLRYFHTPDQVGMSSVIYHQSVGSLGTVIPPLREPIGAVQKYNFMTGRWRDGSPITRGGDGYNVNSQDTTKFVFTTAPNERRAESWSMCSENLGYGDRTVVASTFLGRMEPGEEREVIFGLVYVPSQEYPCPDISYLQHTSDRAEIFLLDQLNGGTFNPSGPDAPDMSVIESNRELFILLSNEEDSNNFLQGYRDRVPIFRDSMDKDAFNFEFEGYIVYQLSEPSIGVEDLDDVDKARVVFQTDLKNEIADISNWFLMPDPLFLYNLFFPEPKVEGNNAGVRKSVRLTEDAFATGEDRRLVNYKAYHYLVIAYAHNSYQPFDPRTGLGQRKPFLPGRTNIQSLTAMPRPVNAGGQPAVYGSEFPITRIDGAGNPGVFLSLEEGMYEQIFDDEFDGQLTYKAGAGPVIAKVVDPEKVRNADLLLYLFNEDESIGVNDQTKWALRDLDSGEEIISDHSLGRFNEQIIRNYGISLEMFLADTVGVNFGGNLINPTNGVIDTRFKSLEDDAEVWLKSVGSTKSFSIQVPPLNRFFPLNYVKNEDGEIDYHLDPTQAFTQTKEPGFVPLFMADYRGLSQSGQFQLSPMLIHTSGANLRAAMKPSQVNNVDIILTKDRSKWTRSIVLQSAPYFYESIGFPTVDSKNMFDYRDHPSIGLDGRYATHDGSKAGIPMTSTSDNPNDPNYIQPKGMGWFPGYAIDVETGKRLNILFGENSSYHEAYQDLYKSGEVIGDDMIWNPNDQEIIGEFGPNVMSYFMGGQHYIYITHTEYDAGESMHSFLEPRGAAIAKRDAISQISWTGFTLLKPGKELLSYEDGLIPHDMVIQLRVSQPYQAVENGSINGMPHYLIRIDTAFLIDTTQSTKPFSDFGLYPNPAFASVTNSVSLCNIPQQCQIQLYDINGRILLHEKLDGLPDERLGIYTLQLPKQSMISGTYFIRVSSPSEGTQVLKLMYF